MAAPEPADAHLLPTGELQTQAPADVVTAHGAFPVEVDDPAWRLEVEDPGGGGVLAPDPERAAAGRLGMNLVQSLSECWGVEHAAERGTRAWAYLPRSANNGNGAHPAGQALFLSGPAPAGPPR